MISAKCTAVVDEIFQKQLEDFRTNSNKALKLWELKSEFFALGVFEKFYKIGKEIHRN